MSRFKLRHVLRPPVSYDRREALVGWWEDLPGRRLRWWRETLREPGKGWLRWGPTDSVDYGHLGEPVYGEDVPPLRRLAWWAIGLVELRDEDSPLNRLTGGRFYREEDLSDCPWYQGTGICDRGCLHEPACQTNEPAEGWPRQRRANRRLVAAAVVRTLSAGRTSGELRDAAREAERATVEAHADDGGDR